MLGPRLPIHICQLWLEAHGKGLLPLNLVSLSGSIALAHRTVAHKVSCLEDC